MKKLFIFLVVFGIAGASLFAWEPQDLTKFPIGQNGKNWILNFGIGIENGMGTISSDYIYIPPLRVTLDRNIEIGDNKLPFFAGGLLVYTGYGYNNSNSSYNYFDHSLSFGGRFGYHFNWAVKNLDTYAVTTLGLTIETYESEYRYSISNSTKSTSVKSYFLFGIDIGARYFVTDWFGFWVELGYNSITFLDIGLAFKF